MTTDGNQCIELDSISRDDNDISKQEALLTILKQSSASYDANAIVETLGGAEQILHDYLSSNDIALNSDQLTKIERIISPNPNDESLEAANNSQNITYTFNKNDTLYHAWFDSKIASCIVQTIYNKYCVVFCILLALTNTFWLIVEENAVRNARLSIAYLSFALATNCYLTVYLILFILTINRKLLKRSITHFVFWFKVLTSIESSILWFILMIDAVDTSPGLQLINGILSRLVFFGVIITYSAIDGFGVSRKIKIFLGLAASVMCTYVALASSWFSMNHGVESTVNISSNMKFSIASLYASSMRVLSIFVWKQTILLIIKKDKCINIRHSPYIKWIVE